MPRTKNPSYLQRRGNVWYASLDIPKPLRKHFDDKPRFLQSLKTESRSEAERRKLQVIAGWKADLEAAKTGRPVSTKASLQAALDWRIGYQSSDPDESEIAALEIDSIAHDIAWKDKEGADAFHRVATGASFPIDHKIEEWLSTLDDAPKTIHMKRTDLQRFAERFKYTHKVDKAAVRKWAQDLEHNEQLSIATVRRIISPCRGYWDYLQRRGLLTDDSDPFSGAVRASKRKTKAFNEDRRKAFKPEEVVKLLQGAQRAGDVPLGQLIWLAMWTGCRIEELCSLKCSEVSGESFVVAEAKSAAGNRTVPIHNRLKPLLTYLSSTSSDGYVLSGLSFNKFGNRSNAIGKRFGRLKSALGFGPQYVFHSIRKTVATKLENALVPESVSADILGHDKPTMTYGIYSGGTSLAVRKEAIEKLSYPIRDMPEFLRHPAGKANTTG